MSYEPTTWATGDIITATKLNNIESGVQSVSSSYTPTTWVTGDIITATKLNNIEQGIVNAGGGSSDFSTAQVTIVGSDMLTLPIIQEADPDQGAPALLMVVMQGIGSGTYNVPLYKGGLTVTLPLNVTVSGDIQEAGMDYFITGDCTITIS